MDTPMVTHVPGHTDGHTCPCGHWEQVPLLIHFFPISLLQNPLLVFLVKEKPDLDSEPGRIPKDRQGAGAGSLGSVPVPVTRSRCARRGVVLFFRALLSPFLSREWVSLLKAALLPKYVREGGKAAVTSLEGGITWEPAGSQNHGMGWVGRDLKLIPFPEPWAGTCATISGCSKRHPAWNHIPPPGRDIWCRATG